MSPAPAVARTRLGLGSEWRGGARAVLPAAVSIPALVAIAAGLAWHPDLVPFALPVLVGWLAGFAIGPLVFLCFVAGTAGFSFGQVAGVDLTFAGRAINPSGLHWGMTFCISGLLLGRYGGDSLPRLFRPYALLVALSAVALTWAPDWFDGLKQVLQYAIPLLLGWLTYRTIRKDDDVHAMTIAWWIGLAFAATAAFVIASTAPDSPTELGGILGSRSFSIYLLPLFALALAGARERGPLPMFAAAGVFVLALLTLSRMVTLVMLCLGVVAFLVGRGYQRLFGLAAVALCGYFALQYEPLRERLFLEPGAGFGGARLEIVGQGANTQIAFGNVNLSGRGLTWLQTWNHSREAPILGHGSGGATVFLERDMRVGISHPHNDYLRVLHDLGWIGFAILLFTGGFVLVQLWRMHRAAATPWSREMAFAALLGWMAYLLMALTDNSMIYATFFTGSVFMLMAIALRVLEMERAAQPRPMSP